MMTIIMEALHSGQAGFYISKTIRCFWCTLYYGYINLPTYMVVPVPTNLTP